MQIVDVPMHQGSVVLIVKFAISVESKATSKNFVAQQASIDFTSLPGEGEATMAEVVDALAETFLMLKLMMTSFMIALVLSVK